MEDLDYIARFAKIKEFDIRPRTIFVEGSSDAELFRLAARFEFEYTGLDLLGDHLAIVPAGYGGFGGVSGVCRELVSFKNLAIGCLLPNGRPKYRFVGLFDNDRAGRQAIQDVRRIDVSILEFKDVFRLRPCLPRSPNLDPHVLQRSIENSNEPYKGLDWELEDLLPDGFLASFKQSNPSALIREVPRNDRTHREWTAEGKSSLHRFIKDYAMRADLEGVIEVLHTLRSYLNLRLPDGSLAAGA